MKLAKKLSGLEIHVTPIKPKAKKKLEEAIIMAKKEIKEWRKFLKDCTEKMK